MERFALTSSGLYVPARTLAPRRPAVSQRRRWVTAIVKGLLWGVAIFAVTLTGVNIEGALQVIVDVLGGVSAAIALKLLPDLHGRMRDRAPPG